jgi:hypothetical protein
VAIRGGDGEACVGTTPRGRDLIVVGAGAAAVERAADEWQSDARLWLVREDGRAVACDGSYLRHGGENVFAATAPLAAIAVWPVAEGIAGEVVATRKTFLRVGAGVAAPRFALNGIVVPPEERDGAIGIQLPAAGSYTITVATHAAV